MKSSSRREGTTNHYSKHPYRSLPNLSMVVMASHNMDTGAAVATPLKGVRFPLNKLQLVTIRLIHKVNRFRIDGYKNFPLILQNLKRHSLKTRLRTGHCPSRTVDNNRPYQHNRHPIRQTILEAEHHQHLNPLHRQTHTNIVRSLPTTTLRSSAPIPTLAQLTAVLKVILNSQMPNTHLQSTHRELMTLHRLSNRTPHINSLTHKDLHLSNSSSRMARAPCLSINKYRRISRLKLPVRSRRIRRRTLLSILGRSMALISHIRGRGIRSMGWGIQMTTIGNTW